MKKEIYRIIAFLVFVQNCYCSVAQVKFVRYQDFEIAFNADSNLHRISKDYDLLHLLLLDSSYKKTFFQYNSDLNDLYKGYSYGLKLSESTVGFVTDHTDISETFRSPDRIMNCLFNKNTLDATRPIINYPIYIKDSTAIVEIITSFTSDVYYFRLKNGIVQINWLGGTIE